jgi:hypothetical protein
MGVGLFMYYYQNSIRFYHVRFDVFHSGGCEECHLLGRQ